MGYCDTYLPFVNVWFIRLDHVSWVNQVGKACLRANSQLTHASKENEMTPPLWANSVFWLFACLQVKLKYFDTSLYLHPFTKWNVELFVGFSFFKIMIRFRFLAYSWKRHHFTKRNVEVFCLIAPGPWQIVNITLFALGGKNHFPKEN